MSDFRDELSDHQLPTGEDAIRSLPDIRPGCVWFPWEELTVMISTLFIRDLFSHQSNSPRTKFIDNSLPGKPISARPYNQPILPVFP
ncbi:hypothetical protein [Poriferisphaera sp. WC338]|uniref:hypothetical protein n=1 Tax=Poriferisphaera sp. WC338 TaxID=3425129 RepID=UPI003D813BA4